MSQSEQKQSQVSVHATNIGGIDETEVELGPGVNVLAGRNATNRTSFLQASIAALGGDSATLKGDASSGHVELAVGGETYTRTLTRTDDGVQFSGDPYLDTAEEASLFAFLLEDNEARQAVRRGDDLREVIMRPVDTDAINAKVDEYEEKKRRLDDRLDQLEELRRDLPTLEQRQTELREEVEATEAELDAKRAELDRAATDSETARERESELDAALDELQDVRSELEDVEFRLDTQRESLNALREERENLEAEVEALPDVPEGKQSELEAEIERLRAHKESLDSTVSQLQRVVQFNEEMLDGSNESVRRALEDNADAEALTDQLVEHRVTCWTCGSEVGRESIDETLDSLRDLREAKVTERSEVKSDIDELQSELRDRERQRRERDRKTRELREVESEIREREEAVADLEAEREDLESEVEAVEARVESLERRDRSEVLELQKEVNELEFELERLRDDLEETTEEIERRERKLDRRDDLERRREAVDDRLTALRTRIERLEASAVDAFNEHMQSILAVLEYENLERVWLERTEQEVREGRRKVTKGAYELHVVRSTDDGTSYEDTVEHLSESEREVTTLVFALAGYLVHDVYETVPFMLLDSLEAIDANRIARLVEYFREYAPYLVVALLPEDAAAIDDVHRRVTNI